MKLPGECTRDSLRVFMISSRFLKVFFICPGSIEFQHEDSFGRTIGLGNF